MLRRDGLDVFWGSSTLLPRLPKRVKSFTTLYDLNFLVVPESMINTHRIAHGMFYKRDTLRADAITAISQGTADRARLLTGRRINAVVTPAANASFRPCPQEEVAACLARLGIEGPYLLAVATWEPRKNLDLLIKVFFDLKAKGMLGPFRLVLAGGKGWKDEHLRELMLGKDATQLSPLGFIADEDLPRLYTGAELFVFPSKYEGYGMPVLEARACGTRVLASDLPEIREAGGLDVTYVAPSFEELSAGIIAALAKAKPGIGPVRAPSWEDGARTLAGIIRELKRPQ